MIPEFVSSGVESGDRGSQRNEPLFPINWSAKSLLSDIVTKM